MSIQAIAWAYSQNTIKSSSKFILVTIANYANENNKCYPGINRIAEDCAMHRASVIRGIKELTNNGLIEVKNRGIDNHKGGRNSNQYRLMVTDSKSQSATLKDYSKSQSVDSKSQSVDSKSQSATLTVRNRLEPKDKDIVSETKSPSKIVRFSPEDMDLANWMFEQTLELNPSRKKPNMDEWAKIIRLMRERDKRSHGEIRDLFKWANNHSFWKANILSPSKLRKQWDRLIPQRNSGNNGNHKSTSASENQFHHDLYRKIAAEAAAEEMDGGAVRAPAPEVWDSVDTPIRRVGRGH